MILTVTLNPALDKVMVVDKIVPRTTVRVKDVILDIGGKGTHVAWVLGKLGTANTAIGLLAGETGKKVENMLVEAGAEPDFIWLPGDTRKSIIVIEESTGNSLMFAEKGFDVPEESLSALSEKLRHHVNKAKITVLSGGVPPSVRTSIYAEMIGIAKAAGSFAILDASGEYLRQGLQAAPDLVKPNEFELNQIYNTNAQTVEDLAALGQRVRRDFSIPWVIVSLAERGCLVLGEDVFQWVLPPAVEEVNCVGCGDIFVAGLTARMDAGLDVPEAVIFASALGATKAASMGTATHDPLLAKELMSQVTVRDLGGGEKCSI